MDLAKIRLAAVAGFPPPAGAEIAEMSANQGNATESRDDTRGWNMERRIAFAVGHERGAATIETSLGIPGRDILTGDPNKDLVIAFCFRHLLADDVDKRFIDFRDGGFIISWPVRNDRPDNDQPHPDESGRDDPAFSMNPKPAQDHDQSERHDEDRDEPM